MAALSGSMSVSLSVRGRPSAFDLSPSNDMAVVASPGCLTLFSLNGLGAPRHVIHYEQPQQIRKVKYQKEGKLAALRGGVVSFWDPLHSLRPLLGTVQSSGWITDMDWSNGNANIIATACVQGEVRIFDIRASRTPVQSVYVGGSCNTASWCPSRPNFLAASNKDAVYVWDTRLLAKSLPREGGGGGEGSTLSFEALSSEAFSIPTGNVQHMAWTASEAACLVTVFAAGTISWWDGVSGKLEASCDVPPMGPDSLILPTPVGKGLVSTQREVPLSPEHNLSPVTVPNAMEGSSGTEPYQKLRSLTNTLDRMDHAQFHPTSIWINGYPRKEFSLMSLYDPKGGEPSTSDRARASRQQMAVCPEAVLGIKWGTPGRLLPHMNGGLELVLLSAETASLHAVALSPDSVNKYCDDGSLARSRAARQQQHTYQLLQGGTSTKDFKTSLKMNPPRYSISGLKRSLLTPSALLGVKEVGEESPGGPQSRGGFWGQLQHEILVLEEALQKGNLSGLSIGRIDQYARQITLEMSKPFLPEQRVSIDGASSSAEEKRTVPSGDERVHGQGHADAIDDSDKSQEWCFSGQVAILIVSFPAKFPQRGLPSFTVRSLLDTKADNNGTVVSSLEAELLSIAKSALRNDKSPSLVNTQLESNRSNPNLSGFLLDSARCFRNRALQVWGTPGVPVGESRSIISAPLVLPADDRNLRDDRDCDGDEDEAKPSDVDKNTHAVDEEPSHSVIDPLAYKVPCPVSSGGIFSTMGTLTCFGGSQLSFILVLTSSKFPKRTAGAIDDKSGPALGGASLVEPLTSTAQGMEGIEGAVVYPRSYADLLLRLRESRQVELSSKNDDAIRGKGTADEGQGGVESNARLGRGLNSGPFYEQFFQNRREDFVADNMEDSSDYGDDNDSKSGLDDDLSGNSSVENEESNRTRGVEPLASLTISGALAKDVPVHSLTSPTMPYSSLSRSFVEDLNVLGEEIDRNQELGGFKPSSYRVSGVPLPPGVAGPLNFAGPTQPFHTFVTTASKSAQVLIFRVYGEKRQKLAREYSFGVIRDFSISAGANTKNFVAHSRGSDLGMIDEPKPVPDIGMRSGSMNNLLEAHASLSQYKFGVMDDSRMHMISMDAHHFPLGQRAPSTVNRRSPFESVLQVQDPQLLQSSQFKSDMPAIRNGADIARTCRYNAALAASLSDDCLANMWLLLAVCFDILVVTEFLDESVSDGRNMKESCRRMVMSGLLRDWAGHALGRPLLCRIFTHLGRVGDLQTMATITCICGGAKAAAFLLGDSALYTSLSLDRILLRYADILHRWQCHVQATEVFKYVTRTVASTVHLSGVEGLSNSSLVSIKLGLYCHRCGREIMPWGPSGGPVVKKGPWCSSCSGFALQCCLCEQVLRGYGYFCPLCGHGGHSHHMRKWFEVNAECPSGCGCRCGDMLSNLDGDNDEDDEPLGGRLKSSRKYGNSREPNTIASESSRTNDSDNDTESDLYDDEDNDDDDDDALN